MAKKANPFETWRKDVEARGVVAVPPPAWMGDWHDMKTDVLSLLDMKHKREVKSLVRVAFGKQAKADIDDDRHGYSILIWPDKTTMVCLAVGYMREGSNRGKQYINLMLPELELKHIDGKDLGWAKWFRKQMPRVDCYYPG